MGNAVPLLVVLALILTLVSGLTNPSKVPLWIPVMILCIALLTNVALPRL